MNQSAPSLHLGDIIKSTAGVYQISVFSVSFAFPRQSNEGMQGKNRFQIVLIAHLHLHSPRTASVDADRGGSGALYCVAGGWREFS